MKKLFKSFEENCGWKSIKKLLDYSNEFINKKDNKLLIKYYNEFKVSNCLKKDYFNFKLFCLGK